MAVESVTHILQKNKKLPKLKGKTLSLPSVTGKQARVIFTTVGDTLQHGRLQDKESVTQFNKEVRLWAKKVEAELKASAERSFGHRDSSKVTALFPRLSGSIKANTRKVGGEIRRIGFSLARHGVHLHYGAGTGFGGQKGSRWINNKNDYVTTNKNSLGKISQSTRPAVHWFNDVIDKNIEELIEITANYTADIVINKTSMYIL